jgi:hypothetical protein
MHRKKFTARLKASNLSPDHQLRNQELRLGSGIGNWDHTGLPESRSGMKKTRRYPLRPDLTESEARQLMLQLEGLARIEGLRENPARMKIPSSTQAMIDSKADEDDVLKHDGSVPLSNDWEIGSGNRITAGGKPVDCPNYKFIKAINQSEGDLHLSDPSTWNVSKAIIKVIRVITSSTDWDLWILQNDNGYAADDANIPKMQIMEAGNGDANIYLDLPYQDEDASGEVHLYYVDNGGANTADIYVIGYEMA